MNSTELALFKELLKETVRVVVKEELEKFNDKLNESIKKANSKDLKEIKALVGKQIIESRKAYPSIEEQTLTEGTKSRLGELFNKSVNHRSGRTPVGPLSQGVAKAIEPSNPLKSVMMQTAASAEFNVMDLGVGELTDEEAFQQDLYPVSPEYGEMDEYQGPNNMPDFPL